MNTLLTPGVVPKSKPKTNLWLNHCALVGFTHKEQRQLALGFADQGCNLARDVLPAGEQGRLALVFSACPSVTGIEAISTTTEPKQRDLAHSFNRPFI